jgi:hypothetical protein
MATDIKAALAFVKREGPILPSQLANELNTNILFASAILSELVSKKDVLITSVKRGGSPFYYVKGQEEKLQELSEYLPGKLKEAYLLIKEKKVLRDKDLEPWQRVALRELKDYAIQLNVGLSTGYEIFWKWYLLSNDEAKEYIKEIVGGKKEKKEREERKEEKKEERKVGFGLIGKGEDYLKRIKDYFEENKLYIISQNIVRKNKEMEFIVDVPSNIGNLRYFVKFKNKKSIGDHDIISALDEANKKGLPLLFLSNGELNKKAESYLNENISGRVVYKEI